MRTMRTSMRAVSLPFLQAALLVAAVAAEGAEPGSPVQVVETLHDGMISVMRESKELSFEQRAARLAPILEAAFDLDFMGRKSLGRSFDTLDPADRKRWLEAFRRFTVANYAGRFTGYSGQRFETLGEEEAASDTVLVRTRLLDPGGENMDLDYRLRRTSAGWKIIDVYLKGRVSELALRRADFSAVLDREGFAALLESVDAKIADLAAGKVK